MLSWKIRGPGIGAVAIGVSLALTSSPARAVGPVDVELAAEGGFTAVTDVGGAKPFGWGYGVRAGASVVGVYAGVEGYNYSGQTPGWSALRFGGEVGYGFQLLRGLVTVRPQLGLGQLLVGGYGEDGESLDPGWLTTDGGRLYLEPGVVALVRLGDVIFVGARAGWLLIPGAHPSEGGMPVGAALDGQVGVRF